MKSQLYFSVLIVCLYSFNAVSMNPDVAYWLQNGFREDYLTVNVEGGSKDLLCPYDSKLIPVKGLSAEQIADYILDQHYDYKPWICKVWNLGSNYKPRLELPFGPGNPYLMKQMYLLACCAGKEIFVNNHQILVKQEENEEMNVLYEIELNKPPKDEFIARLKSKEIYGFGHPHIFVEIEPNRQETKVMIVLRKLDYNSQKEDVCDHFYVIIDLESGKVEREINVRDLVEHVNRIRRERGKVGDVLA